MLRRPFDRLVSWACGAVDQQDAVRSSGQAGCGGGEPFGKTSRLMVLLLTWPLSPQLRWKDQQPEVGTSTMLGPPATLTTG